MCGKRTFLFTSLTNMCNITFEVPTLSTFVFKIVQKNIPSRLNMVIGALSVLVRIILAQRRRQWPSITSALGQCIVLSSVSGAGMESVTRIVTGMRQSRYNHPMLFQCLASVEDCGSPLKQHWVNVTCLRKV